MVRQLSVCHAGHAIASCWRQHHQNLPGLGLLLLLAAHTTFAAVPVSVASIEVAADRTRIVLESRAEMRFTLFILHYPERVMLEIEAATLDPTLVRMALQVAVDHPYLKPVQVRPSPSVPGAVQLEFALKAEAEASIRAFKPQDAQDYRLVLDIVPETVLPAKLVSPIAAPVAASVALDLARNDDSPVPEPFPAAASTLETVPAPEPLAVAKPVPVLEAATEVTPAVVAASVPLAAAASLPAVAQLPLPQVDAPNLVLLEVRLDDGVLADTITAYQDGRETFLPLGELSRLLTLAIKVQPERGKAEGYVLNEARDFSLNVALARLTLAGQTQAFDAALVRLQSDDIYVASTLLARWLPLDLEVNLSGLTLRVRPRERLPLQERLERERAGAGAGAGTQRGYEDPGYPHLAMPYQLLSVPFIDQTVGIGLSGGNGNKQANADYTAYLTGDLLGMEAALYVSTLAQEQASNVRFTLGRHDPDAGLLGLLHARTLAFGSGVSVPSVPNVSSVSPGQGYGLTLSNRPLGQPTSFDRHTLLGDLPPGWDVALYFNEVLVGFQTSRADGRYSFDDQPLVYGPNEFRLVFHGPLGQLRVERQSFLLDQTSVPPGVFYYDVTGHRDSLGQTRSVGQFEWGLNKNLVGTAGFVRLLGSADTSNIETPSAARATDSQLYTNLGVRAFWQSFMFSSELYRSPAGGLLNESGLKTRYGNLAISYSHLQLHDFSSDVFLPSADPLRMRDNLRLDGAVTTDFLPRLPVTLEVLREQFESGRSSLAVATRVAAYVNQTSVSNQILWQRLDDSTTVSGVAALSHRVGVLGLSGQLDYSIKPHARLENVALTGYMPVGGAYLLNMSLARSLGGNETQYSVALNKSLGNYGLGMNVAYSSHGSYSVGLQLFVAMGREPRQQQWQFNALPKADSGAASVRVFLDNNANGVMDAGDEAIENVAINVNASRAPVRTNAAGIAWLDRLPTGQRVDIALDAQTLEDPYWASQRKGVRMVPRPGYVAQLDFPVVLTSEIDGTVYLVETGAKRGIGDVLVELVDADNKLVSSIKSSSDGYYIVPAVPQGHFQLRVSPAQLKQFQLIDPGVREITIGSDAKFVSGVDFLLNRVPASDKPRIPP